MPDWPGTETYEVLKVRIELNYDRLKKAWPCRKAGTMRQEAVPGGIAACAYKAPDNNIACMFEALNTVRVPDGYAAESFCRIDPAAMIHFAYQKIRSWKG